MFQSSTPIAFFQQQITILQSQLPGILDGRADSIHDARIATRRIREVLPLTHEWQRRHVADDLFARIKQAGRSLGKVRDADVRIELLRYLESRIPHAAPSLVLVRQHQERDRLELTRKLVKRFERLGIAEELSRLSTGSAWRRSRFWVARAGAWRQQLRHAVAERAHAAADAVVHATGVYFPNRAHAARIAIKKFRYAVEISACTGLLPDESLIRALKKSQDLLGDIHDRQALIDDLVTRVDEAGGVDAGQIALVGRVAEAEIDDLHARVLARRAAVFDACCAAQRIVQRSALPVRTLAVAGALAVTGFEARRRQQRAGRQAAGDESPRTISVRVPVAVAADRSR